MALRDQVTKAMYGYTEITESFDSRHPYHHKNYEDNLFCPLTHNAERAYLDGSGSELTPYIRNGKLCPAKMSSIVSSSAMTYNLLGGDRVKVLSGRGLPAWEYNVEYEKKLRTLNVGQPAHLDAFLSCERGKTAVFCEMKMLEWLGNPGGLKDKYRGREYYFEPDNTAVACPVDAYQVSNDVIAEIEYADFKRYDAWQMLKHLLAIYNHTSFVTQKALEKYGTGASMAGKYESILLANVVNEFPPELVGIDDYKTALQEESCEAKRFIEIIYSSGIPELFDRNCGAGIKLEYMSAQMFSNCLDMPEEKRTYLSRYFG